MKAFCYLAAIGVMATAAFAIAGHPHDPTLHLHDDINRDLQADIFFRGGTSLASLTLGSPLGGAVVTGGSYLGDAGPGYQLVAISDFDGDRSADVLWSNGTHLKLWVNDGSGLYTPVSVGNFGGGWEPFAAGDINGDGRSDLIFRGSTHLAYWLMDGARVTSSSYAGDGGAGYQVVAIADFTGSGAADILWSNGSHLKIWVSDARTTTFSPYPVGNFGGGWEPFAAGDVNGDRVADILFRGGSHIAYWQTLSFHPAGGFNYVSRYAGDGGAGYRAIAISDYEPSGDSISDVLWSNGSHLKLWLGFCFDFDWDRGCMRQDYLPHDLQSYGGGWQPVEMLIPQR